MYTSINIAKSDNFHRNDNSQNQTNLQNNTDNIYVPRYLEVIL